MGGTCRTPVSVTIFLKKFLSPLLLFSLIKDIATNFTLFCLCYQLPIEILTNVLMILFKNLK